VARPRHAEPEPAFPDGKLPTVFQLLRRVAAVDFTHYKHATIKRRINRRMALLNIEDLADYVALLHANREEVEALYHDILIHVTGFFRDPGPFEALRKDILPKILGERRG